jgi:tRNA A-37 threonylcarbamoyl transferase component Bud32
MPDPSPISALLQQWHNLRRQGQPTPAEQLCADCPELLPQLQERIAAQSATPEPAQGDSADQSLLSTRKDTEPRKTPAALEDATPRLLAGYEILGTLGRGGMGVVYKARHPSLGIEVALKTMRFEAAGEDLADRFLREAQAVVRLNHPHIVRLYDVGEDQGTHYFTMAYVAGGSLHRCREQFAGDERSIVTLMEKVARGVQHAHEQGIIHRDLKPGNILLDEHGEPLVSDFGLAKFVKDVSEQTASGVVLGTAAYMPPEQAAGHNSLVGTHSDVWALGVILYELLTGKKPFEGQDLVSMAHLLTKTDPPRPSSLNHRLDRALETIVLKCLEKNPARRYASAGPLADDLARWLRKEPILARPQPWPIRLGRNLKRRPTLQVLAMACAVAVVVALTVYLTAPPPAAETPRKDAAEDKEAVRRHLRAALARGEKVVLIGQRGGPRWFAWRVGQDEGNLADAPDGAFVVGNQNCALLELLPDPGIDRFVLEAEVRQDRGETNGQVGLYFGHSAQPENGGTTHFFCGASFAEIAKVKGVFMGQLYRYWHPGQQFKNPAPSAVQLPGGTRSFDPQPNPPRVFRKLRVTVTPDWIQLCWSDDPLRKWSRQNVDYFAQEGFKGPGCWPRPPRIPQFAPREGLGLYVFRAAASFKNVTIGPLGPDGK